MVQSSLTKKTPVRRSSRVRRAPIKCVCAACLNSRALQEDSTSTLLDTESRKSSFLFSSFAKSRAFRRESLSAIDRSSSPTVRIRLSQNELRVEGDLLSDDQSVDFSHSSSMLDESSLSEVSDEDLEGEDWTFLSVLD